MENPGAAQDDQEKQRQADSSYTSSQNGDSASNQQAANNNADTASTQLRKRLRPLSRTQSEDGQPKTEGQDNEGTLTISQQPEFKRPRGRPPGSKNKVLKSGPPLIPLVLHVQPGEDILQKLKDTAKLYKRSLVLLAATGTLNLATLTQLQPNGPGVGVTVKGEFALLSMSGSVLQGSVADPEGHGGGRNSKEQTLFLSVSLATAQGGVIGGSVTGPLVASSACTIVVGHWDGDRRQEGDDDRDKSKSTALVLHR